MSFSIELSLLDHELQIFSENLSIKIIFQQFESLVNIENIYITSITDNIKILIQLMNTKGYFKLNV